MHTIAPAAVTPADHAPSGHHRFAELAARTGLEPELAQRYTNDPVAVLAEFGLSAAASSYPGTTADSDPVALLAEFGLSAAEPLYLGAPVVIEDLDRADAESPASGTLGCWVLSPAGTIGA
jgi:hypothetical protein